jgi:hypothetical protein
MQGYASVLRENYFVPSDDDLRNVREIANDSKELKLYRCEAAFTYALLSWDRNEREEAAEYYCEVSRLAEKVKKSERRHRVLGTLTSPDGNHPIGVGAKSMGDLLGGIKNRATDNLEKMQAPKIVSIHDNLPSPPPGRLRSDGTPMPESVYFTGVGIGPEAIDLTREMANHMLSVGGDCCDYCQKTAEEMDLKWLNKCKRCSKAWYCGKDCQLKQWNAGHKKCCRKPGEIKAQDYVRLNGLVSKPELNNMMVKVIGQDLNSEGRWEVQFPGGNKSVSIAVANMEQLRPLK